MKYKTILLLVLLVGIVVLAGCKQSSTGYATYNPQQGQQQPYVGGGCGVAPASNYEPASTQAQANSL
ncbi:hypothetical protein HYX01_01765 [Candidatus Woesearchaeota archaeon]|nr:hypothetical protein [Candidatus Woesearchaeota archaeon]